MKNHKEYRKQIYIDLESCPLAEEDALRAISFEFREAEKEGVVNPKICLECEADWGGEYDRIWYMTGWLPMTEKEIAKAEARRKADKARREAEAERAKAETEKREQKELARLAKKYKKKLSD